MKYVPPGSDLFWSSMRADAQIYGLCFLSQRLWSQVANDRARLSLSQG